MSPERVLPRSHGIRRPVGRGLGACALLLSLLGAATPSRAAVFRVDGANPACSPTGPGSEAQPYCTISAAAAAHHAPGDTILVKPAIYREQVSVSGSGAAGNPLVFRALGGSVLVDGSDDFSSPSQWVAYSGSVYRAAGVNWSAQQVFMDGARLTPSIADPASLPSNAFRWVSGEGLYVNAGGGSPGAHQLLVGHRNSGFLLAAKSWVTIDGFEVARTESRAIHVESGCSDIAVMRNRVSFANSYGIQAIGGLRILIGQNVVSDCSLHGIGLTGNSTSCIVSENESFRNADPAVRRANGIYLYGSPANTLFGNRLHDNQDTGMHFTGASNNCIAYNNRSWNNGDHGYDHLDAAGTFHTNDVAFGNYKDGFSIEGSSPNTHLYNCIAVDNGLTTDEFDLWVDTQSWVGFVSDYNIFWNSTTQVPIKYIATKYATLAAYQAASGQDPHSYQANPRFVNGSAGDFHLQSGSPAIDAGTSGIPNWPATDAQGRARVDDPATPNTGSGPVLFADRGPLEFLTDQAPVVSAPATATVAENESLTVNLTAADPDGDGIGVLTVAGLPPGATFTPGPGNLSGTLGWRPNHAQAGEYRVIFTASNALSGSDTTTITVTNVDRAPVVTAPATATVAEHESLTVDVSAADPDGDAINSLTVAGLPPEATFTPGPGNLSGTLRWKPTSADTGAHTVTFTATNVLGGSGTTLITVTHLDRAPVVTAPAPTTVAENESLTVNVIAADPDGDAINSLTAAGLPPGATFAAQPGNLNGTLGWRPNHAQAGGYTVIFTASNALSGSDTTVITVTNVDRAPVVTAPATATVAENESLTVNVTAADPDGDAIDVLSVAGLPPGATFAAQPGNLSGTLGWRPNHAQAGEYTVIFIASNALSGSDTTLITVANLDRAPVLAAPATATVAENESLTVNVTAADPDGDAIDSLTVAGLPPGATFAAHPGNSSGTLGWRPNHAQAGEYTVIFTASNALSRSDTTTITVTGVDRVPVVVAPATATVAENESLTVDVSAADPDGDAIDSLTVAGLPPGATFTPGPGNLSGTLRWKPTSADTGAHAVTFTAANALSGSDTTVITVTRTTTGVPVVSVPGRLVPPRVVPNPIRDRGHLRFTLARDGDVRVQVFDLTGRTVRRLMDQANAKAGEYELGLDAGSESGGPLPPGLYLYRIQTPEGVARGRFIVLR